ncbi:MAG TPA: hypothetical protein ENN53_06565, partial [Candidatus Acetothermia bacterium]|nr:hypothetical protein [Candidatus Acetothermia bacterium]
MGERGGAGQRPGVRFRQQRSGGRGGREGPGGAPRGPLSVADGRSSPRRWTCFPPFSPRWRRVPTVGVRRSGWSERLLLGAVLVLAGGIVGPAQAVVEVLSPPRAVSPGDVALHVFQAANRGPDPVEARLRVDVPSGWTHLGVPEELFLAPGGEETVFLTVIVPRVASAGLYRVRLVVSGAWGESDASAEVQVQPVAAVDLVPPEPGQGQPGESVSYALGVVNQGNLLDRFFVEASSARGWDVRTSPRELALGPGERGTVQLVLSIPTGVEPGRELLTVAVRSGEGAEARTAWYTTVLPPGPEAIVGTVLSELELRLGGRLEHDPVADRRASALTLTGGGEVLGGELDLVVRLTGPWGPSPYRLDRLG